VGKIEIKTIWKIAAVPVVLLAFYLSLALVWTLFDLPTDKELIAVVYGWFTHYGLWIVFVAALLEGLLVVGQYFPGGFVIFVAVLSANRHIPRIAEVVIVVSVAFFISYLINYAIGKYGFYRLFLKFGLREPLEKAREKLQQNYLYAIFVSYWSSNFAAISSTAAGTLQLSLRSFIIYSIPSTLIWNTLWGIFIYIIGDRIWTLLGFKYAILVFGLWIAIVVGKYYWWDRRHATIAD